MGPARTVGPVGLSVKTGWDRPGEAERLLGAKPGNLMGQSPEEEPKGDPKRDEQTERQDETFKI